MPSGWGYLGACGLAALGVAILVICLVIGVGTAKDRMRDATLVGLGEEGVLTIPEAGSYTIYYYGPFVVSNADELAGLRNRLRVTIHPSAGGPELELEPYLRYNSVSSDQPPGIGGQAVPFQTVRFPQAGDYVVRASSLVGVADGRAGVAFSKSPEGALARWALIGLGAATLGVIAAGLWMILLAGARRRARQAASGWHATGPVGLAAPGGGSAPMATGFGWGPAGPTVVPPPPAGYDDSR